MRRLLGFLSGDKGEAMMELILIIGVVSIWNAISRALIDGYGGESEKAVGYD